LPQCVCLKAHTVHIIQHYLLTLSNRYVIHTKISCFLEKGECCRRNHRWCSKPTNCDLRKSAIYVRYRCPTSTKIEKCRELLEKIPITNLFQHENRVSISRKREIWADSRTSITISTVKLHNVYAKTRNNNSSTTFVTIMSAFCPTSLFNDALKSHVTFVRRDAHRQWLISYGKYARLRNLSNSSVWRNATVHVGHQEFCCFSFCTAKTLQF